MNNIPTEEDFARASRAMKEAWSRLDEVCRSVMNKFGESVPILEFHLFPEDENFRAVVFLQKDSDLEETKQNGVQDQIIHLVASELERVGRGVPGKYAVIPEFDSHENIVANYEGDYFLRLR